uniref:Uncharacterized protein n=1 Tax=Arundo donax TaxID=35708 RepID=A0A0A9B9N0_ARUDO
MMVFPHSPLPQISHPSFDTI